jgi:alpha-mannosidase II
MTPYLLQLSGINRTVIGRINNNLKAQMRTDHTLLFRWRQHFDRNGRFDSFVNTLPKTYYTTVDACGPDPSICCKFDFTMRPACGQRAFGVTKENVDKL